MVSQKDREVHITIANFRGFVCNRKSARLYVQRARPSFTGSRDNIMANLVRPTPASQRNEISGESSGVFCGMISDVVGAHLAKKQLVRNSAYRRCFRNRILDQNESPNGMIRSWHRELGIIINKSWLFSRTILCS